MLGAAVSRNLERVVVIAKPYGTPPCAVLLVMTTQITDRCGRCGEEWRLGVAYGGLMIDQRIETARLLLRLWAVGSVSS
jgi:hypothetical protein